ncbi:4-hydroxy-tetrahydrodipicolinate synthase [Halomicronema hongdechloris C2206]|uniref:4-hydroxy-tetrahydrodipicolinate synthase n=1 Tax=Halomicronema hongdechloris C2206 TaxID=1641165 RepID=A0A1Z3HI45_9CYAN|nr:4-hydroxy-tetrahydrodipicolinate synthase [Halomicronema hongdechloris]ASC69966.1 4-hydroxy-tetrahydrodipicolinate synthase [Halomicronema hongdechloris C2206]
MTVFGRILTAMVTPFTAEGAVSYSTAEALASHLVAHGSDALVVCGTTGESPTLTWDEEYQLFRAVQQAVAGKAMVIAGTGSNSTHEAIEATRKAAALGLDGSLQVVPYYNKPPQEGLYRHFCAIAQAVPDLPLMLYNIPGRTSCNLAVDTVARLAEIPNIVAIKEASGSLDHVSQIRRSTPEAFALYSGDDSLTLPLLAVGGSGVVSVASHLVGDQLQQMVQAFTAGQIKGATQIHLQLLPLFRVLFATTNPIPVKAALAIQGWQVGTVRSPLSPPTKEIEQAIKAVLDELAHQSEIS